MSAGIEAIYMFRLMDQLFSADTQLAALFGGAVTSYSQLAPVKTPDAYLVVDLAGADDQNFMDCNRGWSNATVSVTCVSKDVGLRRTHPISQRVDELLDSKHGGWDGGVVDDLVYVGRFQRTNVSADADIIENIRWYYLMLVYETIAYGVPLA